jgi:hypothetical protein
MKILKYAIILIMALLLVYLFYRLFITDGLTKLDYLFLLIVMILGMLNFFINKKEKTE